MGANLVTEKLIKKVYGSAADIGQTGLKLRGAPTLSSEKQGPPPLVENNKT
jgi:hypothetical protein